MKKSAIVILVIMAFSLCGTEPPKVDTIMEDGVEVILNHLVPYQLGEGMTLTIEEVLVIDIENNEIAELGLSDISHVDVDSEGNIFTADRRAQEKFFFKFDRSGRFLSSFGLKGQGPGEIERLWLFKVSLRDEIFVSDQLKVLVFDNAGRFIKEFRKEYDLQTIIPLNEDRFLATKMVLNTDASQAMSVVLCSKKMEEIKSLDRSKIESFGGPNKVNIIPTIVLGEKSNHSIYTGNMHEYEIRVFDFNGNLSRKIRKENKAVLMPEEDKIRYEQQMQGYPPELKKKFFIPAEYPAFRRIIPHDEKWIFVQTWESPGKGKYIYDVFDSEGRFVARTELEGTPLLCRGDRFYCLREKASGFKELVVLKMTWR